MAEKISNQNKEKPKVEEKKPIVSQEKTNKETKKVEEQTSKKETTKNLEGNKQTKETSKPSKTKEQNIPKKEKACVNGFSLRISSKYSKAICKMIKYKTPENAIALLDGVIQKRIPVKMTGLEVPHQKGKGIAGARFPRNASLEIKELVKQLKANSIVAGIENPVIILAISNKASSVYRRAGRKSKRTHIYLEAVNKTKLLKTKK